jgi:hypothetical protein
MLENGGVSELLQRDQLLKSMPIHKTFQGFQEVRCSFDINSLQGPYLFPTDL